MDGFFLHLWVARHVLACCYLAYRWCPHCSQFATACASCCDAIVKMRGQYPETFTGFHGAREPDCTTRAHLCAVV